MVDGAPSSSSASPSPFVGASFSADPVETAMEEASSSSQVGGVPSVKEGREELQDWHLRVARFAMSLQRTAAGGGPPLLKARL